MKNLGSVRWDVEELVHKVTVQEAQMAVEKRLEQALDKLDPKSRELLLDYFNGTTLEEMSEQNSISLNEARDWINQIKRQLISQLQRNNSARQ
jgi:DNA-directed RNA polymerase specialized sigma24 family protein